MYVRKLINTKVCTVLIICYRASNYETLEVSLREMEEEEEEHLKEISESRPLVNGTLNEPKSSSESAASKEQTGRLQKNIRYSKSGELLLGWTDRFKPGNVPVTAMFIGSAFSSAVLSMLLFGFSSITDWWFILLASVFSIIVLLCLILMMMFVQDPTITTYKVIIDVVVLWSIFIL